MYPQVSSSRADSLLTLCPPDMCAAFVLSGAHSRRVQAGWSYPRHEHPYFEIGLVLEGRQDVLLTGRSLQHTAGELLLLTPFEAHACVAPQDSMYYCVHFDLDDLALRRLLCAAGTRVFAADSALVKRQHAALQQLVRLALQPHQSALVQRLQLSAALFELLAGLADQLEGELRAQPSMSQAALQAAGRLAQWIEQEVDAGHTEASIEQAIRRLGYAPDYGNTLFRQAYGVSARQYRSMLKLRRAKLLLLDATLGVAQVGARLGYADAAQFSRQFKRWSGVSPLAFRRTQLPQAA